MAADLQQVKEHPLTDIQHMLLKTFLNKLELVPESIRHDSYDGKDILTFKKVDGFFPYIEF
jgi:hypothetical protein